MLTSTRIVTVSSGKHLFFNYSGYITIILTIDRLSKSICNEIVVRQGQGQDGDPDVEHGRAEEIGRSPGLFDEVVLGQRHHQAAIPGETGSIDCQAEDSFDHRKIQRNRRRITNFRLDNQTGTMTLKTLMQSLTFMTYYRES